MTKKTDPEQNTSLRPKRKLRLIEVLVVIALVAIAARVVYLVINWRDVAETVKGLSLAEWMIVVAVGALYFVFNRRGDET